MKRRPRDGRPCHRHRLQLGHRRERTRAPDLHCDADKLGRLLLGRELERHCPARSACRISHGCLTCERVHLHDHAIDLVGQIVTTLDGTLAELVHFLTRFAARDVGVYVETARTQPLEQLGLTVSSDGLLIGNGVEERGQVAVRRDLRIFLAQAASGGIARICESLFSVRFSGSVERLEARLGHVDLAAYLERSIAHDVS